MLGKVSLGNLGLVVGGGLAIMGFIAYGAENATLNLIGFFYGIPLLLGGLALKASELKPTPYSQPTPENIVALREQQATDTQKQIIKDVTRYRYGQDVHLDESLKKLGLSPTDEEAPVLTSIKEVAVDGAYTLVLAFDSPLVDFQLWQEKQDRIGRFFGPDVRAEVTESEEDEVEVALIKVNSTADFDEAATERLP